MHVQPFVGAVAWLRAGMFVPLDHSSITFYLQKASTFHVWNYSHTYVVFGTGFYIHRSYSYVRTTLLLSVVRIRSVCCRPCSLVTDTYLVCALVPLTRSVASHSQMPSGKSHECQICPNTSQNASRPAQSESEVLMSPVYGPINTPMRYRDK